MQPSERRLHFCVLVRFLYGSITKKMFNAEVQRTQRKNS
jgi:hypothetical protein